MEDDIKQEADFTLAKKYKGRDLNPDIDVQVDTVTGALFYSVLSKYWFARVIFIEIKVKVLILYFQWGNSLV